MSFWAIHRKLYKQRQKSSERESCAFCLNWEQQFGRTMKAAELHFVECDHGKQMEARELKWGGSLVNKLVQAGLCATKVKHQILAETGQKCYWAFVNWSDVVLSRNSITCYCIPRLEKYISFSSLGILMHKMTFVCLLKQVDLVVSYCRLPLHPIRRCVSGFLVRHCKTVYDKVRQCLDAFPRDPLFTGGVRLGPTWVPIMSQVFVY